MIKLELTREQAQSLLCALKFAKAAAANSTYGGVDYYCRQDCTARWSALIDCVGVQLAHDIPQEIRDAME